MNFDKTTSLDIKEINSIEKELKSIGFKKYKTNENAFVFKNNPKYPSISIEKSFSYDNSLKYNLRIDDNWESEEILTIHFNDTLKATSIKDNKKTIYSKYFNNEIRKQKVKNLLKSDGLL